MNKQVLPLALGGLAIGTTEFVLMGLLPSIAAEFRVTIPQAGYVISAYALGVVIGAPVLTLIGATWPPKRMLLALMALFTVCNSLSALAPSNAVLFALRLLAGLPHGAFFGVGSVVASRLAAPGRQAQTIALMFAGLTVANVLMVPLGTFVGQALSWRYTFGGVGLLELLTGLAVWRWLPALPAMPAQSSGQQLALLRRPDVWLIVLMTSVGTGGLFCFISYIAPLLTEVAHVPATRVPYFLVLSGLGMFVGNALGGQLADRFRPLTACLLLLGAMAASLLLVYYGAANPLLAGCLTFLISGFALALAAPIQLLMIQASHGAEMLGASLTQAAFNIGNALGAFLGGLPLAAGLGYNSANLVGVALALGGVGFAFWLRRRQATQPQPQPVSLAEVMMSH